MFVITNELDIVQEVTLIPGVDLVFLENRHYYFPVIGVIPKIGEKCVPC